jgi:hypothetical protein
MPSELETSGKKPLPGASEVLEHATDVVTDIAHDGKQIVEGYYQLAKHDLESELDDAKASIALLCIGAVLFGTAGSVLAVGLCLALATFLGVPLWASFCGVGVAMTVAAAVTVTVGRSRLQKVEQPEVIADAKKDLKWLAEQT